MRTATGIAAIVLALSTVTGVEAADDIFLLASTGKSPDAVVEAVKAYATERDWRYIGDSKVKQGEVTLVKFCIPEVGRAVWPAGLRLSALLPCGNLGVYETAEATEISLLHPRYMALLFPDPATKRASEIALPLLTGMLEAVAE